MPSSGVNVTALGASGAAAGVAGNDGNDAAEAPTSLWAVTVNLYAVPLVSPVTRQAVAAASLVLQVRLSGSEIAV